MLGLGPIVEGYSLIATNEHTPSMLDIKIDLLEELNYFTQSVKNIIKDKFGECIITEHGRVPPCVFDVTKQEVHCFHAHRLVFPISLDLLFSFTRYNLQYYNYNSFSEAKNNFKHSGEYLYFERFDGSCVIAPTNNKIARQFFRFEVAEKIGKPELANWKKYPNFNSVEIALEKFKI